MTTSALSLAHLFPLAGQCLALLLPTTPAHADMGPKPTMDFTFDYQISPVSILGGELLQCEDAARAASSPLKALGPQRFECTAKACSSTAYGYTDYQKLRLTFADKTRESNVFRKKGFSARHVVTVNQDGLSVREVFTLSSFSPYQTLGFCLALPITLIVELAVAAIYLARIKMLRSLVWVAAANGLSLPVVWFIFPLLGLNSIVLIALAELFAVVFEAFFLHITGRRRGMSLRRAATLSLLMNAASFALEFFVAIGLPRL